MKEPAKAEESIVEGNAVGKRKRGEKREDGRTFFCYRGDGREVWVTDEQMEHKLAKAKARNVAYLRPHLDKHPFNRKVQEEPSCGRSDNKRVFTDTLSRPLRSSAKNAISRGGCRTGQEQTELDHLARIAIGSSRPLLGNIRQRDNPGRFC